MKHHFKYANGYINLDDENLYLTSSGNWQEVLALKEKDKKSLASNTRRIGRMKGFVIVVYGIIVLALLQMVSSNTISFTLIGLFGIAAYYVLEYFKSDFGVRYKIPIVKISSIERYEKGLKINFLDANNESDSEIAADVDPVGIGMLTQLQIIKYDLDIR